MPRTRITFISTWDPGGCAGDAEARTRWADLSTGSLILALAEATTVCSSSNRMIRAFSTRSTSSHSRSDRGHASRHLLSVKLDALVWYTRIISATYSSLLPEIIWFRRQQQDEMIHLDGVCLRTCTDDF
jgi:hypothetical protein